MTGLDRKEELTIEEMQRRLIEMGKVAATKNYDEWKPKEKKEPELEPRTKEVMQALL